MATKEQRVNRPSDEGSADTSGFAIDPVCGMQLDPAQAAAMSEFDGQRYCFCSAQCKEAFDEKPDAYVPLS